MKIIGKQRLILEKIKDELGINDDYSALVFAFDIVNIAMNPNVKASNTNIVKYLLSKHNGLSDTQLNKQGINYNTIKSIQSAIDVVFCQSVMNVDCRKTYIYLAKDNHTGLYKIGCSFDPKQRESTLQSEKPSIKLIFKTEAERSVEKYLHSLFKKKRIRGEWFNLSESDVKLIKSKKYKIVE